jgi:predicted ABC-type transport system involved in lysophospholipase L1 biosynthesis ATPase subunit
LSCSVEDLLQHASGRDDALATEVESEINQYRHQAHCIAEMLATLGRLQRLVHSPRRTSGGEQRASRLTACEAIGVAPAAAIASLEAAGARS